MVTRSLATDRAFADTDASEPEASSAGGGAQLSKRVSLLLVMLLSLGLWLVIWLAAGSLAPSGAQ